MSWLARVHKLLSSKPAQADDSSSAVEVPEYGQTLAGLTGIEEDCSDDDIDDLYDPYVGEDVCITSAQDPRWVSHNVFGPFDTRDLYQSVLLGRVRSFKGTITKPPGLILVPEMRNTSGNTVMVYPHRRQKMTFWEMLQRAPDGLLPSQRHQLLLASCDLLIVCKHGTRCVIPSADDFVWSRNTATDKEGFAYWPLHKVQLVTADSAEGHWMQGEQPGVGNYDDPYAVLCLDPSGTWKDTHLGATMSALAQLLHMAETGCSVAGSTPQERLAWHTQVKGGMVPGCPLVLDAPANDLIQLHLVPGGGGSAALWLKHAAVMRHSTTFGGSLMSGLGAIMASKYTEPLKSNAQSSLRKSLAAAGKLHLAGDDTKGQLGPLAWMLSYKKPDRQLHYSRGEDRDWDYWYLPHVVEATRHADGHQEKAGAKCIANFWKAVNEAPVKMEPHNTVDGRQLAASNKMHELLTLAVMPRLQRRFKEFAEAGQEAPLLIDADFSAPFVTALQRTIRCNPCVKQQFGASLGQYIRESSAVLEDAAWYAQLDRKVGLQEEGVLAALIPAPPPITRHLQLTEGQQHALGSTSLLLGAGSSNGGAHGSLHAVPDAAAGQVQQDDADMPAAQAVNHRSRLLSDSPPLTCRGTGFDWADPAKLGTVGKQQAVLPGRASMFKRSAMLLGSKLSRVGLGYAQQLCYGLLFAAAAQHVAGTLLPRLVLSLIHLIFANGFHPFGTEVMATRSYKQMDFAMKVLQHMYPGLQLPGDVLSEEEVDWLTAHVVWWTGWTQGWKAARKIKVPVVGDGLAQAAWSFASSMSHKNSLQALQELHTLKGPMRRFWVRSQLVQQLRSGVPGAAAIMGHSELQALKLVQHLCLEQPPWDDSNANYPVRCCLPDPASWPDNPMAYKGNLVSALEATMEILVEAGYVPVEVAYGSIFYFPKGSSPGQHAALKRAASSEPQQDSGAQQEGEVLEAAAGEAAAGAAGGTGAEGGQRSAATPKKHRP